MAVGWVNGCETEDADSVFSVFLISFLFARIMKSVEGGGIWRVGCRR